MGLELLRSILSRYVCRAFDGLSIEQAGCMERRVRWRVGTHCMMALMDRIELHGAALRAW